MFLHPWALIAGALAVGLPVAVHFFTKPRPVRMPLSTIRFVREAIRIQRARHRLRDFVVLVLRTLAVLLVALAIARPQPNKKPLISDGQTGSTVRIVILDASQSMAAVQRGVESLERARTVAASYLRYRPGLRANLIVAGARAEAILTQPSQNFEALRDALARVRVRPERLDVNRALAQAAEALAPRSASDQRRRELVVVSDFQRSNWASADFACLPEATLIQLESTALDPRPANLALLRAEFHGRPAVGTAAHLEVDVGNYSPTQRQVTVEVTLGESTYRLAGTCPANRRSTLAREIPLRHAGWQVGKARLVDSNDALAIDDTRGVVARIRGRPLFVLISRQSATRRPSSSHFLECGLVPDLRLGDKASASFARMSPGKLDRETLAAADLIAIDHPGKMPQEEITLLAGLIRRGHSLLYVASETVDATNLRRLTEAAGADLQMPVEFSPPSPRQPRQGLFLTSVRKDMAPFDVFGESVTATVSELRFFGGLNSRHRDGALQEDLLATYNDGTACLVQTSSGAGALAVLNADLSRSNLPRTGAFVPLLDRLVQQLLERGQSWQQVVCGEPLVVRLPSSVGTAEGLRIAPPKGWDSTGAPGLLANDGAGVVWRWSAPVQPGVYRVMRGDQPVFAQTISVPDEESQLESLSADVLENRLAAGRSIQFRSPGTGREQRDVMWTWFLMAGVLCLLGELTALLAFRS